MDMPAPLASNENINDPRHNILGPGIETDREEINWSLVTRDAAGFLTWKAYGVWEGKRHDAGDRLEYNENEVIPGTAAVYSGGTDAVIRTDEDGNQEVIVPAVEGTLVTPAVDPREVPILASGPKGDAGRKARWRGYSNKDYPYGTGFYRGGNKKKGAWSFPEKKPQKNYIYWGDFLLGLPGHGFFTNVNNEDYSPSKILPDGTIVDGEEINEGLVQFIIQNVIAPLPKNRRISTREGVKAPQVINAKRPGSGHEKWRLWDVCYGDLFAPKNEEKEKGKTPKEISFADLTNLTIDNVADMPIRRDVVDNLMSKNNGSMSISSFFAEIFKPKSIGIQSANVNIGARQRGDGTFEIFQANKNWDKVARQMIKEYDELTQDLPDRYPPKLYVV